MSVCTFIASNFPLKEVALEKEYDNYYLLPFNGVSDYTDMKYGVYLEDEANIESHQYYYGKESLSHVPEFEAAHIARV